LPFHPNAIDINAGFSIPGRDPSEEMTADYTVVTPDYFQLMGIPVKRGRGLSPMDIATSSKVVLINEAMARRFWPNQDPVGQTLKTTAFGGAVTEIVGVVGDTRHTGLDRDPRPELFFPHAQQPTGSLTYVVRTTNDPGLLVKAIKQRIWDVNPNQPFETVATLTELVEASVSERRFHLTLLAGFALIALGLAAVGIYGVISFMTARRTAEIGVRMAMGADRADILRLVVGGGLVHACVGLALGVAASLALTRVLSKMLFGVSPADPVTFFVSIGVLLAVAAGASFLPALRATRVDPVSALRTE
jgi:predicted permease